MAVNTYECLFLLDPNKSSANWDTAMSQANGIIERNGGEIVVSSPWGEPKLAYPVKKFKKGTYLLTYFKAEPSRLIAIERETRLTDLVLRHLIIKLHPAVAEQIIAHLNDPQPEPAHAGEGE